MHRSLVALSLAISFAHSTQAATITATASGGAFDNPVVDTDGPANAGSVLAEVIDNSGGMTARAALDVNGNSAVELNGVFNTSKPHLAGVTFPQVTDGETTWSETLTNMSIRPKSYLYSFHLNPISLSLTDFTGDGDENDPGAPVVSYRVEVRANNVLIFESQASLKGGGQSHVLTESGTDLGGTAGSTEGRVFYDFSPFDGTFSAGTAGPGGKRHGGGETHRAHRSQFQRLGRLRGDGRSARPQGRSGRGFDDFRRGRYGRRRAGYLELGKAALPVT